MKTKILGGIAIVAIAIAVALNVNMTNKKSDKTSLLALANVEALPQSEVSNTGQWWNTSSANLTGLTYKGRESYGKNVYDGYTITSVPEITTDGTMVGLPAAFGATKETSRPYEETNKNYVWVKCCKDSYNPTSCSDPDWRC